MKLFRLCWIRCSYPFRWSLCSPNTSVNCSTIVTSMNIVLMRVWNFALRSPRLISLRRFENFNTLIGGIITDFLTRLCAIRGLSIFFLVIRGNFNFLSDVTYFQWHSENIHFSCQHFISDNASIQSFSHKQRLWRTDDLLVQKSGNLFSIAGRKIQQRLYKIYKLFFYRVSGNWVNIYFFVVIDEIWSIV